MTATVSESVEVTGLERMEAANDVSVWVTELVTELDPVAELVAGSVQDGAGGAFVFRVDRRRTGNG